MMAQLYSSILTSTSRRVGAMMIPNRCFVFTTDNSLELGRVRGLRRGSKMSQISQLSSLKIFKKTAQSCFASFLAKS
jgi:hypothetical protein